MILGVIGGAMLGGLGINRWGRQPVLLAALVLSLAGIFLRFFSTNIVHFFGSNLLTGLVGLKSFSYTETITPASSWALT